MACYDGGAIKQYRYIKEESIMKAAVIYGVKDVKIEEVNEPSVSKKDVKVKVSWAGICGSDLHAYHYGLGIPTEPNELTGVQAPLVLGHEFAGTVVEIGEDVTDVAVGDRVAIEPLIYPDDDVYVRQGRYNLANKFAFLGVQSNGGFAEYAVMNERMVHKLPENVSLEEGALIEPTAVALQAVRESQLKVGQTVVVFGVGPIGLLTIISAKTAGAAEIIAVDISNERLALAKEVGATITINSMEENPTEKILSLHEHGVDIAYEAAGAEITFNTALTVLKKRGQLMVIAAFGKPVSIDVTQHLMMKEINITASFSYCNIFPEVIHLIASGRMDVKKVITKKIALDDLVENGLELLEKDKSHAKILIDLN